MGHQHIKDDYLLQAQGDDVVCAVFEKLCGLWVCSKPGNRKLIDTRANMTRNLPVLRGVYSRLYVRVLEFSNGACMKDGGIY